jgi:hypothetical protein
MSYNVYRVTYAGFPCDHHAIFVEMNSDQSGWLFQVTGDIQNGMKHNDKPARKPEESGAYQSKTAIETVAQRILHALSQPAKTSPHPRSSLKDRGGSI